VFSAGALYILRLIVEGPDSGETGGPSGPPNAPGSPLGAGLEAAP
jgi:hypothetical protein